MNYVGRHLSSCNAVPFSWHSTWLVVVSGDGPNVCGRALLKAGFFYFHIDGWANRPYYLTEDDFQRYMMEAGKSELFRRQVHIRDPEGAQRKLEALSAKRWHWGAVPNNCVSYVEEILDAGGSNDWSLMNCPLLWR
jgi:hypothetical protein